MTRLRRATTLVASIDGSRLRIHNFLDQSAFLCAPGWLAPLAELSEWTEREEAIEIFRRHGSEDAASDIEQLTAVGALVAEGSEGAGRDEVYRATWEWGPIAGLYHFGTRDIPFADEAEEAEFLAARGEQRPSPALWAEDGKGAIRLAAPALADEADLLETIFSRRSLRNLLPGGHLALADLGTCLAAGGRVLGTIELPLRGRLPLKPAPSGGARNPFEIYLDARAVEWLEPGVYRYGGQTHSLTPLTHSDGPPFSELVGGQEWANPSAAVLFLVAYWERPAWKYVAPSTYGSVLIEAGHIAQNVLLAATALGLANAVSAALLHHAVERRLGVDGIERSAIYAIALGEIDPAGDPLAFVAPDESAGASRP
ncbi:MAG TPA: SagB/ThcOx family dehydrogenase [Solirubrobacterales bacterium]|nr:SagB/ThcOx family dehydrogenase [Solirubrobacterales bacterium]